MVDNATGRIDELNQIVRENEIFCILTRDSSLQEEACSALSGALEKCSSLKADSIDSQNEVLANLALGFECVLRMLISELKMWILLKQEEPDKAWDYLIEAQMAASDAARAHKGFTHVRERGKQLEDLERTIFPPQVFFSAGLIVRKQICTVCGSEYGTCGHIVGRPYWGEFCCIRVEDFEANHFSMVEDPADKRCRVITFEDGLGERNRMTWKVVPPSEKSFEKSSQLNYQVNGSNNLSAPLRSSARLMHIDTLARRRS
ncbi:hypothetical protein RPB_0073 [Rhodopseudomonas palustris HaA2]|uniref:Uncharacterized protein n=1 Tax=Rhodopseudomonas palustris (strain HaA2) TaxID=316058 RepID=Q2J425_RHOP2|nr:hypothetical protein [Rhodopseudomonas palustris]ABD04785.1 hypothetical protein RPB_0073 [Rhodopseudomonas palustris HaA2]